ncbi:MAG TPA: SDR family oxidoreductase [Saprospiraceae bacterium]|nr:SDR family oxidoreductase [Saprospiraceae bacterium]
MDFTGKYVLVTGSSRGIGAATARAFAQRGARVALHYRSNRAKGEEVLASLAGEGHLLLQADIADPQAVEDLFSAIQSDFERLDVVVNNAGIFDPHPIDEVDYQTWQRSWQKTLDINLIGAGNVCYWAAQGMMEQGGGRIINVSSRGAFRGEPEFPAYGASKAGLNALSQSLAKKLGKYNIGVYAVAPGFVATDMAQPTLDGPQGPQIKGESPLDRVARPEEVAHAILFYASEQALFMTGGIIDVNGASYLRS